MHSRRRKRVTFADDGSFRALKHKKDASSDSLKFDGPRGEPKTLEYKSFRKIIEEAATKLHSNQHHQDLTLRMKEVGRKKEKEIAHFDGSEDRRPPFHIEVAPIRDVSFDSQTEHLKSPGVSYCCKGLFHEKRREILKLTAEALSVKVDELGLKSHDFIPKCLKRLGTDSKTNKYKDVCQNNAPLESEQKRIGVTDQFCDASYSEAQSKDFDKAQRGDDVRTTLVQYEKIDMFKLWCNQVCDVIPFRQKDTENPFTTRCSEEMDMDFHNKLSLLKDFERRDSLNKMELGFHRDHKDNTFWLLPETDIKHQKSTDPSLDPCRRDLLTELDFDAKMDPSTDFAVSNHLSMDGLDFGFANKNEVSLYPSNFEEQQLPLGIIPCEGCYLEQSFRTFEWPRLLEVEFDYPNEISGYGENYEIKLLGWKENVTNEVPVTSDFLNEKKRAQLPLTLYQGHDSSSMIGGSNLMDCLSWESKHGPSLVGNCFGKFQDESCPSLDVVLVPPQLDFPLEWKSLPVRSPQQTIPWHLPGHFS